MPLGASLTRRVTDYGFYFVAIPYTTDDCIVDNLGVVAIREGSV